eukprot:3817221-Karenia_brevis.AAC.1
MMQRATGSGGGKGKQKLQQQAQKIQRGLGGKWKIEWCDPIWDKNQIYEIMTDCQFQQIEVYKQR